MTDATCKTCPWWARFADHVEYEHVAPSGPAIEERTPSDSGECRKLPPLYARVDYNIGEPDIGHTFPVTPAAAWCGEHPGRDATRPQDAERPQVTP